MLFLALVILNIPVYAFFYASNQDKPTKVTEFFMKMSLGNIGAADLSCIDSNWATSLNVSLTCGTDFA